MLSVENLQYSYVKNSPVLTNVSLSVSMGETLCLLGPNGTGKTTLLRCILHLLTPQKGNISLKGENLKGMAARDRSKRIAYVPQASEITFALTVEEVILMGRTTYLSYGSAPKKEDYNAVEESIVHLGIEHLRGRFFHELSGGEKQMVLVARALVQQAEYLVMDEPTASLDYSNQIKILQVINRLAQEGYGILMTSHFPEHAFLVGCKVALMSKGEVIFTGTADDGVTTESLSSLYQTQVKVVETEPMEDGKTLKVCVPIIN